MKNATIVSAWWSNKPDDFGNFGYGLEYESGDRIRWLAGSLLAAEEKAAALAAQHGVSAGLIDFLARAAARNSANKPAGKVPSERDHRIAVVCGKIAEQPLILTNEPLEFDAGWCGFPSIGGILAELPLSAQDSARYPAESLLAVTVLAVQNEKRGNGFVVCEVAGKNIAMTVDEAYERGLRESNTWG